MAVPILGKGAVLTIGSTVTGVISLDLPDSESETYEADYLDNPSAGIPYQPSGRVEGGKMSGEVWLSDTSYPALLTLIQNPTASFPCPATIRLSNNKTISLTVAGVGIGGTLQLKEGVKGKLTIKVSGIPTYA